MIALLALKYVDVKHTKASSIKAILVTKLFMYHEQS